ncbi:MAG TPA: mandelate racemase/muconate lactonizing enzyme family protein [bacterium]|nr:mandelate racemase/muconate lactonizing enzyme family protein [bacterium]
MRIIDVRAVGLEVPIRDLRIPPESLPYYRELGRIVFDSYKTVLVRVETDEGVVGIGECMTRVAPYAMASLIEEILKPVVVGNDPFDYELIWDRMFSTMRQRGHSKGFMIEAMSGVDIAIWDVMGRVLNKPIYSLLGGKFRDRIRVYASSIRFKSPKEVVEEVATLIKRFKAVKLKIGRGVDDDVAAVRALRDAFGYDLEIMVDANSGYSVDTALKLGRKFEKLEVEWFEEPIPPDNLEGYVELAHALDIPIAAGESEFTRFGFRELITRGGVDIIQPNVGRAGGFTEVKRILALASAYGLPYAPHTGSSAAPIMVAELHLATYAPNFLIYEYMHNAWSTEQPNPLKKDIVNEDYEKFDGEYLLPPSGVGLGITLNDEYKKYLVKPPRVGFD